MIHVSDVLNFELWLIVTVENSEVSSLSLDSCWNDNFKQPKRAYSSIFDDSFLYSILFNVNHIIRWYNVIKYRHIYFCEQRNVMKGKIRRTTEIRENRMLCGHCNILPYQYEMSLSAFMMCKFYCINITCTSTETWYPPHYVWCTIICTDKCLSQNWSYL